jgi:hypothetical protein
MWYTVFGVRTQVRSAALPATSQLLGPTKKSRKCNHCHTSAISARNSFACHTYKNNGLSVTVLCLPQIPQMKWVYPVMVNLVAA